MRLVSIPKTPFKTRDEQREYEELLTQIEALDWEADASQVIMLEEKEKGAEISKKLLHLLGKDTSDFDYTFKGRRDPKCLVISRWPRSSEIEDSGEETADEATA